MSSLQCRPFQIAVNAYTQAELMVSAALTDALADELEASQRVQRHRMALDNIQQWKSVAVQMLAECEASVAGGTVDGGFQESGGDAP